MQIVVLGMHRSGTSTVARILNLMNIYFGPEGVSTGASLENKKGFWERKDVRQLNDFILRENDFDWYKIAKFNGISSLSEGSVADFDKQASHLILNMDAFRPWFIKEPRLCLTYGFWKKHLEVPVIVYVYRNPVEVALSLQERNSFPIDYGLKLWEKYNVISHKEIEGAPIHYINYNDLMQTPFKVVNELQDFLIENHIPIRKVNKKDLDNFIDPSLHRQKVNSGFEKLLTPLQMEMFSSFGTKKMPKTDIDRINISLEKYESVFEMSFNYKKINKLNDQLSSTNESLEKKAISLAEKVNTLQEANLLLSQAKKKADGSLIQAKDAIREKQNIIRDTQDKNRDIQIQKLELQHELRLRDDIISKISNNIKIEKQKSKNEKTKLETEKTRANTEIIRLKNQIASKDQIIIDYWDRIQSMRLSNRVKSLFGLYSPKKKKTESNSDRITGEVEAVKASSSSYLSIDGHFTPPPYLISLNNSHPTIFAPDLDWEDSFTSTQIEHLSKILNKDYKIDIIIPIYNGIEEVKKCIESVFRFSIKSFQLVLVNDKSTDSRIENFLADLQKKHENVTVINNEKNLGFVKSANVGFKASNNDVILLNSDTEVSPRWLNKLIVAAYSIDEVATVTPFSNASGAFSVPKIGINRPVPYYITNEGMARLVENQYGNSNFEIPTGNGFCLFIKRQALNDVGYFDEISFKRGYGEENDLCMRLLKKGWKNILCSNLFIYHKGSVSFGEEKGRLMKEHRTILNQKHPEYTSLVSAFVNSGDINSVRDKIGKALDCEAEVVKARKENILYILHEGGGGVPATNKDLMKTVVGQFNVFTLTSNSETIYLKQFINGQLKTLYTWTLTKRWSATGFHCDKHKEIYFNIIHRLNIDIVHIRHFFKQSFDAPYICKLLDIPFIVSFHDFYLLSPSINLLNKDNVFTGSIPETWNSPSPLLNDFPRDKHSLERWQTEIRNFLSFSKAMVTTSQTTKDLILQTYPELKFHTFKVIEHGRDFNYNHTKIEIGKGRKTKLLVAGNLDLHKGSMLIRDISQMDLQNQRFEFHFIGTIDRYLDGVGIYHGKYQRNSLSELVDYIKPDIGLVLSICPETYCHTLSEMWSCGIPVVGSEFGAVGERIRKNGGGWLVNVKNPMDVYNKLIAIINTKDEYVTKLAEARKLRFKSTKEMGSEYQLLYDEITVGHASSQIGLLAPGKGFNGSTYIRAYLPYVQLPNSKRFRFHLLNNIKKEDIIKYITKHKIQRVIFQRNSVDDSDFNWIEQIKKKTDLILEIDDDLINIDRTHPEHEYYAHSANKIKKLLGYANLVTVSTPNLKAIMKNLHHNVVYIPNRLDQFIWFNPFNPKIELCEKKSNTIAMGYIGTITHHGDLLSVKESIIWAQEVLKEKHNIILKFYVIGGTKSDEEWFERISVPSEHTRYPLFVKWLRTNIRWDFSIAPLENTIINKSKSHIKFLEYSALGLPGIYSNIGEYKSIIRDGENGILVDNHKTNWKDAILKMSLDSELRIKLLTCAKNDVVDSFLLKDYAADYLAF